MLDMVMNVDVDMMVLQVMNLLEFVLVWMIPNAMKERQA
jgi:hypothetical protein